MKKKHEGEKFEITQADYEESLRQGADPEHSPKPGIYTGWRRADRQAALKAKKVRVTMLLDSEVVEYFKQLAEQPGAAGYQSQINSALLRLVRGEADSLNPEFIKKVAAAVKRLSK